jgi:hypothetical protein
VKRYYTTAKDGRTFEHPDGPFVLWADHVRALDEAGVRYRAALFRLTDSFKYSTEVVTIAREALGEAK